MSPIRVSPEAVVLSVRTTGSTSATEGKGEWRISAVGKDIKTLGPFDV